VRQLLELLSSSLLEEQKRLISCEKLLFFFFQRFLKEKVTAVDDADDGATKFCT